MVVVVVVAGSLSTVEEMMLGLEQDKKKKICRFWAQMDPRFTFLLWR